MDINAWNDLLSIPNVEISLANHPIQAKIGLKQLTVLLAQHTGRPIRSDRGLEFTSEHEKRFAHAQITCNQYLSANGRNSIPLLHLTPMMFISDIAARTDINEANEANKHSEITLNTNKSKLGVETQKKKKKKAKKKSVDIAKVSTNEPNSIEYENDVIVCEVNSHETNSDLNLEESPTQQKTSSKSVRFDLNTAIDYATKPTIQNKCNKKAPTSYSAAVSSTNGANDAAIHRSNSNIAMKPVNISDEKLQMSKFIQQSLLQRSDQDKIEQLISKTSTLCESNVESMPLTAVLEICKLYEAEIRRITDTHNDMLQNLNFRLYIAENELENRLSTS